ncbi:hypothetical protein AAMO2058_001345100 [Amorphochlora amoebiformis]
MSKFDPSAYLKKFGWNDGAGLGKNGSGIKTFVKVSKRERDDMTGIGTATDNWNHASKFEDMFAKAAAKLRSKKKQKKKSDKKKKGKNEVGKTKSDPYAGLFQTPVMFKQLEEQKKKNKSGKKSKHIRNGIGLYADRSKSKLLRLQKQEAELLAKLTGGTSKEPKDETVRPKKKRKKKSGKKAREKSEDGVSTSTATSTSTSTATATSTRKEGGYRRSGIRQNFEAKIQFSDKKSRFNTAGGLGFTSSFQASYYEQMIASSVTKKKKGLGFGVSATNPGSTGGLSMFVSGGSLGSEGGSDSRMDVEKKEEILSKKKEKKMNKKNKEEDSKKSKPKKKTKKKSDKAKGKASKSNKTKDKDKKSKKRKRAKS